VDLVGVARLGTRLLRHGADRLRVERAEAGRVGGRQRAAQHHRPGPPLLEGRVVEEGPGLRAQDLVGERRWLAEVARHEPHLALLDAAEQPPEPVRVHGLGEAVAQRLGDERVVGRLDRPGVEVGVVLARDREREDRREQVVGPHARDGRRHLPPAQHPRQRQRARRVPAPADREHGRLERRLREHLGDPARREHPEDRGQREGVLRAEGEEHAVVGGGGLQLEVEGAAEPLAEREPQGPVLAGAEGGVQDELHAPGLVEEALGDERVLRGEDGERLPAGGQVVDRLPGPGLGQRPLGGEPGGRRVPVVEPRLEVGPEPGDLGGERRAPSRGLAEPERDARRRAARVLHPHHARLDAPDAPGGVAEQEDVAGHALDREVLVDLPHRHALRLGHHLVLGAVGDGPSAGEGGDAGAAAAAEDVVHGVAVEERAGAPAARGDPVRQHGHDRVELAARQLAVRPGAPDEREELVLAERPRGGLGDDLLGEHVARPGEGGDRLQLPGAQPADERRALHELVPAHGEEARPGRRAPPVAGAAGPLQGHVQGARAAQLGHEVDGADVDAELEGGGGHDGPERPGLEAVLGVEPAGPRQAAVVGRHEPLPEPLPEGVGGPLGELAGVHEDERGPGLPRERGEPVVGLGPLLLRGDRRELVPRDLHAEVERPPATHLHHGAVGAAAPHPSGAHQEAGHLLHRGHRGGEPDALRPARAQGLEPLQREGEVAAPLVARHRVDLVDDDLPHRSERAAPLLAREEQVERLGRGDEDVGGAAQHRLAARGRGVAGADRGPDGRGAEPGREGRLAQRAEGLPEVLLDVVRQRLERRDVEDAGLVGEVAVESLPEERVEPREEGGEGLAGPGGGRHEHVAAGLDLRPAGRLRLGR